MKKNENRSGYKKTKVGWIPEDWECWRLGDFFVFKNGLNKEKKFFSKGTPIVNYMDVYRQRCIHSSDIEGHVTVDKKEITNYSAKKGDVFFTRTSETLNEIGMSSVLLDNIIDAVFSGFVLRARPVNKLLFDQYKTYCFSTYSARKEVVRKSSYTTRALTNGRFLSEVLLATPSLPEQEAIVEVLECWDKAIRRYKKKIKKKRNLKKGLMQRLLSGNQRLPGFEGEWKEVRLGKCGKFFKGKGISKDDVAQAGLPCIRYGQIYTTNDHVAKDLPSYINSEYTRESTQIQYNDLLLAGSGETIDEIGKALAYMGTAKAYAGGDIVVLRPNLANVWADYLAYYLNTEGRRDIRRLGQGQSVVHVYSRDLMGVKLPLPSEAEQRAIATVLSSSDAEISTLECKLATLQDQKRFLLNNMVTGTIRLPQFIGASKSPDANGDTK